MPLPSLVLGLYSDINEISGVQMKHFTRVITLVLLSYLLSACGGGGGGGGGAGGGPGGLSVASLQGSWYGTLEDDIGNLYTIGLTVDGAGNVTSMKIDGTATGDTAVITKESAKVFGMTISDGTNAGFIVDAAGTHAGFVDDTFFFAVLQKNATSLPTFARADVIGSWSGYGVTVDAGFNLDQEFASSATVDSSYNISGSDALTGSFTGSFGPYDTTYGRHQGSITNTNATGNVSAFLSPDKNFAATWACFGLLPGSFPVNCSFSAWNKQ